MSRSSNHYFQPLSLWFRSHNFFLQTTEDRPRNLTKSAHKFGMRTVKGKGPLLSR